MPVGKNGGRVAFGFNLEHRFFGRPQTPEHPVGIGCTVNQCSFFFGEDPLDKAAVGMLSDIAGRPQIDNVISDQIDGVNGRNRGFPC